VTYEYLSGGPPEPAASPRRPSRTTPLLVGGLLAAIGVLLLGWLVVDWGLRNAEMRALVTAIEGSEQAMSDTQVAVRAAFEPYAGQENLGDDDQEALRDELSQAAATGEAGVAAGGQAVAAIRILPWHGSLQAARDAYLAHNAAWQSYLSSAADDPTAFVQPQDAVNSTWATVQSTLPEALPAPALFGLADRVAAMVTDEEDGDGGGGPQVSAGAALSPDLAGVRDQTATRTYSTSSSWRDPA
jgi:hypothetical protein